MLLVAPTWAEIEAVTEKVRSELKSSDRLASEEKEFQVFHSLSWTEAQKRMRGSIVPAWPSVFIVEDTGCLEKGEMVQVVAVEDNSLKSSMLLWFREHFPIGRRRRLRCW